MHELQLGERDLLSFLRPDTFVGAAIYLASRAGDYVIGETIVVDGGISLMRG